MKINELARRAYNAAQLRGHYQDETGITGRMAYIHRDVSRALDAHTRGEEDLNPGPRDGRPTGPMAHLADAAIRTMTLSHAHQLDLEEALGRKLALLPQDGEVADAALSHAAWNAYSDRDGDPGAARFEEMIWDGHTRVAENGGHLAREILALESFGVRPEPGSTGSWNHLATDAAEILSWTLAAAYQRGVSLPELISAIIDHDEGRTATDT